MSTRQDVSVMKRSLRKKQKREFPGGPVIRIWCFHCQGQGSIPGPTTKILQGYLYLQVYEKRPGSLPGRAKGKHGGMELRLQSTIPLIFLIPQFRAAARRSWGTQGMKVTLQNLKMPDMAILFHKWPETRRVPRKYFPDHDLYILLAREIWSSLGCLWEWRQNPQLKFSDSVLHIGIWMKAWHLNSNENWH